MKAGMRAAINIMRTFSRRLGFVGVLQARAPSCPIPRPFTRSGISGTVLHRNASHCHFGFHSGLSARDVRDCGRSVVPTLAA